MKVHVICCNDSVQYAFIGDEAQAHEKMLALMEGDYARSKWSFRDRADYHLQLYWHIHTVDGEDARQPLTQAQIDALLHLSREADEGPTALIRRVECAHDIIGEPK